jgi:isopentenyl-diphosphate Delta-isomerase
MGLGSLRAVLEAPHLADTFRVRHLAPGILLFANLGAVQLNTGVTVDDCRRAVDLVEADALILHLNPLQEALQAEGDTQWSGLLHKIAAVCRGLQVPVVAKEVGWGISGDVARRLVDAGVAAIDVAGAGGTSWSQVEMYRAPTERRRRLCARFAHWGIPTAQALVEVRQALPAVPLIASGGLRTGLDLAKVLALGAGLGGLAGPFLKAANASPQAVADLAGEVADELRIILFCLGLPGIAGLKGTPALRPCDPG